MATRVSRFLLVAILAAGAACSGDEEATPGATAVPEDATAQVTEPVTDPSTTEAPATAPATEMPTEPPASDVPATEPPATEPPAIEPPVSDVPDADEVVAGEHVVQFVGCEQWALYQAFDPALAEGRVTADVELLLDEDGNAGFLHLAHSCEDFAVDGESTGPAHMDVEWVSVTGPAEQRELPDLEGYTVLPTAHWELVLFTTDNEVLAERMAAIGVPPVLVDEMVFHSYTDLDEAGAQVGSVRSTDPSIRYRWFSIVEPMALVDLPVVFVHDVHSESPDGTTVRHDVVCPGRARIQEAVGAIAVEHSAANIGGQNEPIGSTPLWDEDGSLPGVAHSSELDDACSVTFTIG